MPKIRKRNEEAAVFVKNNLEGFDPELSCANRTNDSLGAYRIDVLGLVSLHCAISPWALATGDRLLVEMIP